MWIWILTGLNIITKANGYASGTFPESCEPMAPNHDKNNGQTSKCPFEVSYEHGGEGEPITVFLRSITGTPFKGFMLQARKKDKVDEGRPVGKFIFFEHNIQFMKCNDKANSTVTQENNQKKTFIKVNWTAEGEELDIIFRATFVQSFDIFWERVDVNVTLPLYTTSTTKQSTTTSTTKPSTTKSTTNPSTTKSPPPNPINVWFLIILQCLAPPLTAFHSVLTMASPHIALFTLYNSPSSRNLYTVLKISCSVLCAVVEILALVFFCVGSSCKVTLVALVCAVIVIDLIELVILCLPLGPSHKLEEIFDLTLNVCSVISLIFTVPVIFIGVLEIEACKKSRRDCWLLIVMFFHTVWIFLFVIWVFLLSTHLRGILWSIIGEQRQKEDISAAKVLVIAVPVILIVGAMLFAVAITVGIFSCCG